MANVLSADGATRRHAGLRHWWVPIACLLAVGGVVVVGLASRGAELLTSLGDTDDATRLVELHAFLGHGNWWNLTLDRIGAPDALVSHWSRLVDLGLALTLGAASLFLSPPNAELAMRIVWPSLMLFALLLVVARDVERDGGLLAALGVIALAATSHTALYQFNAGRIDHHNVQIFCGIGGVLLAARSLVTPRMGWWAGALTGVGLTVGLEAAMLVGPAFVVAVLLGLGRPWRLEGQMRAAAAMAATVALLAMATIDPAHWTTMICDAVAFNLVGLITFGAAGVVAAGYAARHLTGRPLVLIQLAALGVCGFAGLGLYGSLEPRCLAGPFGMVTPELWPVWLSHVTEVQPIGYLYRQTPGPIIGYILLVVLGLIARLRLAYVDRGAHGEQDSLYRHMTLFAVQLIAFAASCWQVKMMPYAAWLALPALAVGAASLQATSFASAPLVRIAALVLVMQSTLTALVTPVVGRASQSANSSMAIASDCSDTATISALSALPPGLVLAEINLGPYIVALTPHRVVLAPYHRLDREIVKASRVLSARPELAEAGLRELGVTYVVACTAPETREASHSAPAAGPKHMTLGEAVATARAPAYLAPVPLHGGAALRVYRLLPPKT